MLQRELQLNLRELDSIGHGTRLIMCFGITDVEIGSHYEGVPNAVCMILM
jgi:hypothetical protein